MNCFIAFLLQQNSVDCYGMRLQYLRNHGVSTVEVIADAARVIGAERARANVVAPASIANGSAL
jgi:hypothetical protein